MQLNIYLISHPIIQILSNFHERQISQENNCNIYQDKQLGLLIIYEAVRKKLDINYFHIKKVNYINKINLLNKNNNYYILSNLTKNYNFLSDINLLIPNSKIIHIEKKYLLDNRSNYILNIRNKEKTYIIIFEKVLNDIYIIDLIKYLIEYEKIPIQKILIVSIKCYHYILEKLGNNHPQLTIYTTEII